MEDAVAAASSQRASATQSVFPINQLPREILAQIFTDCVPDKTNVPIFSRNNAPLLLCHVCSSWRELALATPKIWTVLGIIIRDPDADPSTYSQVINTWLKRSGTLPLTLYLGQVSLLYDVPLSRTKPGLIKAILSVFYTHSSRWEDVTLTLYESTELSFPRLGKLPLLRAFHLSGRWAKPIRPPFSEVPRLTRFTWPCPLDASTTPQIPWSQISKLDILTGMTLFSASEMIRLCPQLEKFTVNFSLEYADVDSHIHREPTSIVENHRLRRLSIRVEEDCSPFLHSLTLPSLTQFDCSFFNDLNDEMLPFTHQALLEFLTRSKCKLQKLKLGDCKLSAPAFLECLAHETLETIQSLDISHHPKLTDDILIHLTDLPTSPRVLLPKLTHLELEMCLAARRGMLGKMVFSRCCSPGHEAERLESLQLMVEKLSKADKKYIEDAIAAGLDASIDVESE